MEKMILTERLKQANPAEQAKTEAEIVKAKSSVEKEALSLQKAELNAAEDIVAVGNPCKVLRKVGEHDIQYFYKDEMIDWENLL